MMKYGLLRCGNYKGHHYWSQLYSPIPQQPNGRYNNYIGDRELVSVTEYKCPKCGSTYLYEVVEHNQDLVPTFFVVRTFENVPVNLSSYVAAPKDSIRLELEAAGFVLDQQTSNDHSVIYVSPEGYKAKFNEIYSHRKTQILILLTPPNDKLIKKIDIANKKDKKAIMATLAKNKKPKLEFIQDVVGTKTKIDDWVAYSGAGSASLKIGQIVSFTNKTVTLRLKGKTKLVCGKSLNQIIKLSEDQVMLYILAT